MSLIWCESLGPGYLVPRPDEPGFLQRKVQEKLDFSVGSVLKYFRKINKLDTLKYSRRENSFFLEFSLYKSWLIVSGHQTTWAKRFTPL